MISQQSMHLESFKSSTSGLTNRLQEYRKRNRELERALEMQRLEFERQIAAMKNERNDHIRQTDQLVAEVKSLQSRLKSEMSVAGERGTMEAVIQQKEAAEQARFDAEQERDAWKVSFEAFQPLREKHGKQSERISELQGMVKTIAAERDAIQEKYAKLELDEITSRGRTQLAVVKNETDQEPRITSLTACTGCTAAGESLASEREGTNRRLASLQGHLDDARETAEILRIELDDLKSTHANAIARTEQLEMALRAVERHRDDIQTRLAESEEKRNGLVNAMKQAESTFLSQNRTQTSGSLHRAGSTVEAGTVQAREQSASIIAPMPSPAAKASPKPLQTQAAHLKLIQENISETLVKIPLHNQNNGEAFFESLKKNAYIVDYDDTMFICYCQTPLNYTTHRAGRPNDGRHGFRHLESNGPSKPKVPYRWKLWAAHASQCGYLKVGVSLAISTDTSFANHYHWFRIQRRIDDDVDLAGLTLSPSPRSDSICSLLSVAESFERLFADLLTVNPPRISLAFSMAKHVQLL